MMKPCSNQRKVIAMLAMGELDARRERVLRSHLDTCEGCRSYLAEISRVRKTLMAAETAAEFQASEVFHRNVMARLRMEARASRWEIVARILQVGRLNWRVAAPAVAAALVLLAALAAQVPHSSVRSSPRQSTAAPVTEPAAEADLPPTMANYQAAAGQSLREFDELLTEQARKPLPPAPVYTASMLTLGNGTY
jgi:anti-sigma factor RsiW